MVHMLCCAANIADILPTRKLRTCWNYYSLSSEELKGLQQAFPKVDSSTAAKHFTQNHIIIIEMLEENLGENVPKQHLKNIGSVIPNLNSQNNEIWNLKLQHTKRKAEKNKYFLSHDFIAQLIRAKAEVKMLTVTDMERQWCDSFTPGIKLPER